MTAGVVSSACLHFSEQGEIVSVGLDSGDMVAVETVWDTVLIVKFVLLLRAWAGQNIISMQLTVMQLRATATDGTTPTPLPSGRGGNRGRQTISVALGLYSKAPGGTKEEGVT